jgi:folate-dependent phosphoribosylglycinamide formyltransferase PurN
MEFQKMRDFSNWAIFISGRGSNLCAALDQFGDQIKCVVSTSPRAAGILRAKRAGLEILILKRPADWKDLTRELKLRRINKIFLLGFMKILPVEFINDWSASIINLHPSLLPAYPGLESIERAFLDRNDLGVTVHEVIPEVDAGKILLQKKSVSKNLFEQIGSAKSGETMDLEKAEFKVHQDEQILVRKIIER